MPDEGEQPYIVALPGDDGVLLGNLAALPDALGQVDAVVSLCRVGTSEVPTDIEHHEVWLVERSSEAANPNLDLVLDDAAEAVRTLRDEGKRVFLHCVGGRSRTPTVAALYLAGRTGTSALAALDEVAAAIPDHDPHNTSFLDLLARR